MRNAFERQSADPVWMPGKYFSRKIAAFSIPYAAMTQYKQEHQVINKRLIAVAAMTVLGLPLFALGDAPPSPAVAQRFKLPGSTGWDYLSFDQDGKRLFISRADHVQVMDSNSGQVVGEIAGTDGVHGIVLVPELKKGFTSNGKSNSVTVFDLASLKVSRVIPLEGKKPDAIIYDSASKHVLAFNGGSNSMSVIDPAAESVLATVPLPGRPEFAAADGHGRVYLNLEDKAQVTVIDTLANKVLSSWTLGACEEPSGLALDTAHHRVFSTCQNNKLVVLDTGSGKPVAELPIGGEPDATAFDPATSLIYSSNGEGTLTVIKEEDANHFRVMANVPTQKGARTMALDAAGQRIFLATAEFGPPPAATAEHPHPRPSIVADSFTILLVR